MFFFAPFLQAHPQRARLVAVADADQARLRSAVADLGGNVRAYARFEALLGDPEVEAVIIATPDFTHRQLFDQALDAGKHVLCEKPMATTLEDALHMARRAMAVPQVVQIGFMLRYAPFCVQLKQAVDAGVIGPLQYISAAEVVEYYHGAAFFRRWHRFRRYSGGLLVHKACHTLDVINWLVGAPPVWVTARGGTDTFVPLPQAAMHCCDCSLQPTCPAAYRPDRYNYVYQPREASTVRYDLCAYNSDKDSIDNAALLVQYANGVRLSFGFTITGARHDRRFLLVGQHGQITASQADGTITVTPQGGTPQTTILPETLRDEHGGGDAPLLDDFLTCVAQGTRPVADVLAGLHSVALGDAATRSLERDGQGIDIQLPLTQ